MERGLAVAALLVMVGCAADTSNPCAGREPAPFPDSAVLGYAEGARIVADPAAEFPINPVGLPEEAARALVMGENLWGVANLDGWTIIYDGGWFPCSTAGGYAWTYGCTYPSECTIRVAPDTDKCRSAVLVHEVGHVAGVNDHSDPRYAEADALAATVCSPAT